MNSFTFAAEKTFPMKYLFLFVLAGSIISCTGNDQPVTNLATRDSLNKLALADSVNYTSIEWIDSTHSDLGTLQKGQAKEVAWRFRNSGNKPLIIEDVRAGCGCTVAEKPQEPIPPGNEGVIKARFNSAGQSTGENNKNVTVIANTKGNTNHVLSFRVEVTE